MTRRARVAFLILFLSGLPLAHTQQAPPNLVLTGTVTGSQNKTYFDVPFQVPSGIHRISVDFSYTGRQNRTTLDIGIADPQRFRGNSGGNKSHFTLSETDATPSYLPGPILPGTWKLLIAVPNIRPSQTATYRAEIRFNSRLEDESFTLKPLSTQTRWYRGDLHMHTAHSDGSCPSQSGKSVPCPLFVSVQSAAAHGLDFIAITEHNTVSHYNDMRELQPYFDKLLLIPGREITTFWGHFNIFGTTQFVDYRAVAHNGLNVNAIVRDARAKGAIASVNHARSIGGEACMGCRWEPPWPVDMRLFTGVEVINGGGSRKLSSADFWDGAIAAGIRLTAIGGSDNHRGAASTEKPGGIGWPTTVVEASGLSVPAILDGIRRGRVFIDVTASHDKLIDITAHDAAANTSARMGESLAAKAGDPVAFHFHIAACPHSTLHLFFDGHETPAFPAQPIESAGESPTAAPTATWTSDGKRHWLRAEVRDAGGNLLLVSNPIYLNFPSN